MNQIDLLLFQAINGLAGRFPALDRAAAILTVYAPIWFGAGFLLLWMRRSPQRDKRRRAIIYAVVAGCLALLLNALIAWAVDRPRPYLELPQEVNLLVDPVPLDSFPSAHASGSLAFATVMVTAGREIGWAFGALGILVALSRIYVGVHWPTDVLASLLIGLGSGAAVMWLRARLEPLVSWILRVTR